MQKTLRTFQKRLTNLSSKNRSLLLLKLLKKQHIDLLELDFLENTSSYELIAQVLRTTKSVPVCAVADSRDQHANQVSHQLKDIHRTEKFIYEESGSKDLFIGYPMLEGKLFNDMPIRCPLLFIPVTLESQGNKWLLQRRQDVAITFNKTFLLAYSYFNNIPLDENFIDTDFSQYPSDLIPFLTELYKEVEESALEIHFNQENFESKLVPFWDYKKAEFEEKLGTGQLKLFPQAVLGIFPQADSYLIPDYDQLLEKEHLQEFEDLVGIDLEPQTQAEEKLFTPYPIDASQEDVVKRLKNGQSIVVQGPPGSGKSQLICNLVADYISRGKNVLVVSQKKAALNVVFDRLEEKGLAKFSALVHDHKHDRAKVYDKILNQVEAIEQHQLKNNSLDAIFMERSFTQKCREIEMLTEQLEQFRNGLFSFEECGKSAKELYLSCSAQAPSVSLVEYFKQFHFDEYDQFVNTLKDYVAYYRFDRSSYIWSERKSFAGYGIGELKILKEVLDEVPKFRDEMLQGIKDVLNLEVGFNECERLLDKEREILRFIDLLQDDATFKAFQQSLDYPTSESRLKQYGNKLLNTFGEYGLEKSVDRHELPYWHQQATEAAEVQLNWFKRSRWKMFAEHREDLQELLLKNGLMEGQEHVYDILVARLDNRMNYEHYASELGNLPWVLPLPKDFEKGSIEAWIERHLNALAAKDIFEKLHIGLQFIDITHITFPQLHKILLFIIEKGQVIKNNRTRWINYLDPRMLNKLLRKDINADHLKQTLHDDFEALCAFDNMKDALYAHESGMIEKVLEYNPKATPEESEKLFHNSIHLAWLESQENRYPVLTMVSSGEIEKLEKQLQKALTAKAEMCKEIVLLHARERTYKFIEYNRLGNMVTYRDLKHQVSKKRLVWPMRKLIKHHVNELLDLLPCWIASPESVSTLFPLEKVFDLVIFDEASQCFAEKGIPAMYRGKQVAILGDAKQLSPYDLYQNRWEETEDDDEYNPALEMVSLLDLGERFLPQTMLKGHYRSQSLDLIDFSNQYFYKNRLYFLPEYDKFVQGDKGISFVHVSNGTWQNSTNLPEAEEVVRITIKLLQEGLRNIGIITFNYKQQELIQELLEAQQVRIPDNLFVKNIENVQGDERDIIIFSITYAPDTAGRLRANFGSLNAIGGENRLNVAITRARKKVYVVSSLMPQQLKVDEAKNDGPRLLKRYLEYAFDVSAGEYKPTIAAVSQTPFGLYLRDKIEKADGYLGSLQRDLPFADLSIKTDKHEGLVLTDDDLYFQSISVKESHAYLHFVLTQKGWQAQRFYSREFWKDPEKLIGMVKAFEKSVCLNNENDNRQKAGSPSVPEVETRTEKGEV
ncbi:AAA domain-containing protein [Limibacter armeniacum]|uniref:AAA domain-containing protein n=1 Tax=Limibacter armeniacum TaxID=466084 RepID=UPI002FE4FBAA